jgi:hypothetical protein
MHQALVPPPPPTQSHDVDVPSSDDPVTVPAEQVLAAVPQTPLTAMTTESEIEHQAFEPPPLPAQVQDVELPLSTDPVTVPAAQLLAPGPHAPFTVLTTASDAVHQAFVPPLLPAHVQ